MLTLVPLRDSHLRLGRAAQPLCAQLVRPRHLGPQPRPQQLDRVRHVVRYRRRSHGRRHCASSPSPLLLPAQAPLPPFERPLTLPYLSPLPQSGANAIALSWGLMEGWKPPPQEFVEAATSVSRDVVERLYDVGWGEGDERVDVYTVNVPVRRLSSSIGC